MKPNRNIDNIVETTIAIDVAKPEKFQIIPGVARNMALPLMILSAYLMTIATNKPPNA